MGNLLGGFLMLALCVRLAVPARGASMTTGTTGARAMLVLAALLLTAQIALGRLTSASYAGLACGSWADCALARPLQQSGWASLALARARARRERSNRPVRWPTVHRHAGAHGDARAALTRRVWVAWRRGRRHAAVLLLVLLAAQLAAGMALSAMALPLPLALLLASSPPPCWPPC